MDPPRRPGSGWLQNAGGNKNQPTLAPAPDPSRITRAAPLPADLIARDGGDPERESEEAKRAAEAAKEAENKEEEEELCAICYDQLPDVGRGIIACGHVYCFACILKWCKTQNDCPGCRFKIKRILKTLSPEDISKEKKRKEREAVHKYRFKKQRDRAKRKAARVKPQKTHPNVVTKQFRVRPASLRPTPAEQRSEPHPQAPGGWMYAQDQEAARQRLEMQQLQQQQQQRQIRPVQARGELAEMAETMRLADADAVESVARDQPANARSPSPLRPPALNAALVADAEHARARAREADRARRSGAAAAE
eukprot:g10998.t1